MPPAGVRSVGLGASVWRREKADERWVSVAARWVEPIAVSM